GAASLAAYCRSMGHSTLTGPVGADRARPAASARIGPAEASESMVKADLLNAVSIPSWSLVSWMKPRPRPRCVVSICPVRCSTRDPAASDSIREPAALPAPVPVLVIASPMPPRARPYPSAALTAAASCRTGTKRRSREIASISGMLCTLTTPNAVSMPTASISATTRSPPLGPGIAGLSDIAANSSSDAEGRPGGVGRVGGEQEDDGGGDLGCGAETREADAPVRGDLLGPGGEVQCGVGCVVAALPLPGIDQPDAHRADADVLVGELAGQGLGQVQQAGAGGPGGDQVGFGLSGQHRVEVDHGAAARRQVRQCGAHRMDHPEELQADLVEPLVVLGRGERGHPRGPGVVDQILQTAEALHGVVD